MKKIGMISFTNPFVNSSDGGKVEIINRIKALNLLDSEIDFFSANKKDETEKLDFSVKISNIHTINIKNKLINFLKKDPISVSNRYSEELINRINQNIYDLIIYENFNMYKYRNSVSATKHCLRVHNIESLSRRQLFISGFPSLKSFAELLESIKYYFVEKKSLELFDYFLFISSDEMDYMSNKFPNYKHKFIWMPPVVETVPLPKKKSKISYILYYGDLTISHNIRGIKWYVDNVFSKISNLLNVKLIIIGKISETDKKYLNKKQNVEVLGYVEDLDQYISQAEFIVAPILTGAGVKIKVLHALSKGKLVITTPKGVEGTSLKHNEHLLICKDAEDYLEKTIYALNNPDKNIILVNNALSEISKNYSIENQKLIFANILEGKEIL